LVCRYLEIDPAAGVLDALDGGVRAVVRGQGVPEELPLVRAITEEPDVDLLTVHIFIPLEWRSRVAEFAEHPLVVARVEEQIAPAVRGDAAGDRRREGAIPRE